MLLCAVCSHEAASFEAIPRIVQLDIASVHTVEEPHVAVEKPGPRIVMAYIVMAYMSPWKSLVLGIAKAAD